MFRDAGVTMVIADNDHRAHNAAVIKEWKAFGIDVWPGAGIVGDRKLIPNFTGKTLEDEGGFPVNSPDCMPLDQTVNNTWKNTPEGLEMVVGINFNQIMVVSNLFFV